MEDYIEGYELRVWQASLDDIEYRLEDLVDMRDDTDCPDEKKELDYRISGGVVVFNQICAEMIENHCGDTKH